MSSGQVLQFDVSIKAQLDLVILQWYHMVHIYVFIYILSLSFSSYQTQHHQENRGLHLWLICYKVFKMDLVS